MSFRLHHDPNMGFQEPQFLKQYTSDSWKYLRGMLVKRLPTIPIRRQAALQSWKKRFKVELMELPLYHLYILGLELSDHKPLSPEEEHSRKSMPTKYATIHTLYRIYQRVVSRRNEPTSLVRCQTGALSYSSFLEPLQNQ
jgi:hypothetical protein